MIDKVWKGRFQKKEAPLMETFNASISYDKKLYRHDIKGSLAHAKMLNKIGLLNKKELTQISNGLEKIEREIETNRFNFDPSLEDIHMAIEGRLTQLIGPTGGKLHSARSRNDQVALDMRLYVRDQTQNILQKLSKLQKNFVCIAEKNQTTILPGYTHLQRAQPILLAHHLLAYFEMFSRDADRFQNNLLRLDQNPLGAGALAGSPIKIDRKNTTKTLGFSEPTHNSLDSVSDRDFLIDFLSAASIFMMHLSRLSEELILWNSQEFGFVTLPMEYCTGSSMMPQKVNPDAMELIRGKTGRVYGNLMALLTTLKALPLAYNKDMQEDKEPVFDSTQTLHLCLDVLNQMIPKIKFNADKMLKATKEGFMLATDLADYLSRKGVPFRKAHEIIGSLVQKAIKQGCGLEDFDLQTLKKHSKHFESDVKTILQVKNSVNSRQSFGGTATKCVKTELARAKKLITK